MRSREAPVRTLPQTPLRLRSRGVAWTSPSGLRISCRAIIIYQRLNMLRAGVAADDEMAEREESLAGLLARASHLLTASFSRQIKGHGVSATAWRVLGALAERDGLTMTERGRRAAAPLVLRARQHDAAVARAIGETAYRELESALLALIGRLNEQDIPARGRSGALRG